jgi:hypothetical protein
MTYRTKLLTIAAVALTLTGCSSLVLKDYQPTLDKPYTNKAKYDKDIAECREWGQLTERESAQVDARSTFMPLALVGMAERGAADTDPRDKDKGRRLGAIPNINLCMERRGYAVNEMESHVPGGNYP